MENKLKPCPFCGASGAKLIPSGGYWKIKCDCGITVSGYAKGKDAVTAWNNRPTAHIFPAIANAQLQGHMLEFTIEHVVTVDGEPGIDMTVKENTEARGIVTIYQIIDMPGDINDALKKFDEILTPYGFDFHCPCGCMGKAEECVYAAKCPQCSKKFYGGSGYADRSTLCAECKDKTNLCEHCTSEFTCPNAAEGRSQCKSFGHG